MTESEKRRTTMRARRDLLDRIDKEALARGWSRTTLIEQLMAKWLRDQGHEVRIEVVL